MPLTAALLGYRMNGSPLATRRTIRDDQRCAAK